MIKSGGPQFSFITNLYELSNYCEEEQIIAPPRTQKIISWEVKLSLGEFNFTSHDLVIVFREPSKLAYFM